MPENETVGIHGVLLSDDTLPERKMNSFTILLTMNKHLEFSNPGCNPTCKMITNISSQTGQMTKNATLANSIP
jgi:hypothetical protein